MSTFLSSQLWHLEHYITHNETQQHKESYIGQTILFRYIYFMGFYYILVTHRYDADINHNKPRSAPAPAASDFSSDAALDSLKSSHQEYLVIQFSFHSHTRPTVEFNVISSTLDIDTGLNYIVKCQPFLFAL